MLTSLALLLLTALQVDTVRLTERLCRACEIQLEPVATLGDADGPGMVSDRTVVVRDSLGRILVADGLASSRLSVFSAQGTFLRSVGRAGGGPGEYGRIWQIAPVADGVYLYDDIRKRRTRLTLEFAYVGSRPALETPQSQVVRADGSGVMAALVPTRDRVGHTLHEFDSLGQLTRSMHAPGIPFREDLRQLFRREVAAAVDGASFWVANRYEYIFARCFFGPAACETYARAARWFPAPDPTNTRGPRGDRPPAPILIGVSQESPSALWTITLVPDATWRSAIRQGNSTEWGIANFDGYYDTVIERIDLVTRRVIASRRIDPALRRFVGPAEAWHYSETDDGVGRVHLVKLVLKELSHSQEE